MMEMVEESVCPKCGQMGTQSISVKNPRESPNAKYLTVVHPHGKTCYIGRVRTTDEVMGELNKPETVEEYEKALKTIGLQVRDLIEHYSRAKSGSVLAIVNSLRSILEKYGY